MMAYWLPDLDQAVDKALDKKVKSLMENTKISAKHDASAVLKARQVVSINSMQ